MAAGRGSELSDGLERQTGCLSAPAALALSGWLRATAPWDRRVMGQAPGAQSLTAAGCRGDRRHAAIPAHSPRQPTDTTALNTAPAPEAHTRAAASGLHGPVTDTRTRSCTRHSSCTLPATHGSTPKHTPAAQPRADTTHSFKRGYTQLYTWRVTNTWPHTSTRPHTHSCTHLRLYMGTQENYT